MEKETGGNKPLSKAEQDRIDQANEMAGREVGRQRRFLPEGADPVSMRKRRERDKEFQSRLMALLRDDPEYAALYNNTMDKLRVAEAATETALAEAEQALHQANLDYQDTLGRASTLPDGTTKVFRDADGNVRTEDGRLIEDEELDRLTWKDGAPSYEDFLARKQALEEARRAHETFLHFQVDLGDIRNRMVDSDSPPSVDDLKKWNKQLEEINQEMVVTPEPDPEPQTVDAFNHTRLKL